MSPRGDIDAARVLPHRGPALLVRGPLRAEGEAFVCSARVSAESPWIREGRAPALLGLEMGAQVAALAGAHEDEDPPRGPRVGFVVGIRAAVLSVAWLPVGEDVDVRVERVGGAGELRIYAVSVLAEGAELVRGRVSVFVTNESPDESEPR